MKNERFVEAGSRFGIEKIDLVPAGCL